MCLKLNSVYNVLFCIDIVWYPIFKRVEFYAVHKILLFRTQIWNFRINRCNLKWNTKINDIQSIVLASLAHIFLHFIVTRVNMIFVIEIHCIGKYQLNTKRPCLHGWLCLCIQQPVLLSSLYKRTRQNNKGQNNAVRRFKINKYTVRKG